ncbi:SRPBCC family protein [Streptomyces sp. NBC_01306]|uniref:SRPBCC family protein n=1 Tax=Streptomyces sp. NBC_01306 TaxID=2903819 RepID=UPI002251FFC0|nr:SRPBCC family protein [Streptomyces sp. NBC_01306]MCX4728389.1 SRPBCC family protein [Streptomyces sp. NBC_01306]
MKSVTVSIHVPQTPEQVYGFLDVMAHHERFTNHYLTDWRYSGPARGIGSCVTVTAALGGTKTDVTIEVVEADVPRRIVERNVSAAGRRVAHGTYAMEPLRTGGTHISFTYRWVHAPLADRLLAPAVRTMMRRANSVAMRRLATELAHHVPAAGVAEADEQHGGNA